jgi:hypothetical protein
MPSPDPVEPLAGAGGHPAVASATVKLWGLGGSPRDRFARQVLRTVQTASRVAAAHYDKAAFSIEYRLVGESDGGRIYLENTFRETEQTSAQEQSMRIRRLVDAVVGSSASKDTWAQARSKLRPVLRSGTFGLGVVDGSMALLSRPAQPFLMEAVVVDEPTSMAYVTSTRLAEWSVSADEVYATARANLAMKAPRPGEPPTEGPAMLRFVDTGDAYFTSMLLVDGFLSGLASRVGGRPVAFVPDRDTLIVVADEPGLLTAIYGMVEEQYREAPRSISPVGYTVDDRGAVVPYPALPGSPLREVAHRAEVLLAAAEYSAQKEALDAAHERDGVDIFVGSVLVLEGPDQPLTSVAVWAQDVDTLLPQADYVAFPSAERVDEVKPLTVPFDAVTREAALLPEPDYAPPRYRVTRWPDESVRARLSAHAVEL